MAEDTTEKGKTEAIEKSFLEEFNRLFGGRPVTVERTSGKIESDWNITALDFDENKFVVHKKEDNRPIEKKISLDQIVKLNPDFDKFEFFDDDGRLHEDFRLIEIYPKKGTALLLKREPQSGKGVKDTLEFRKADVLLKDLFRP